MGSSVAESEGSERSRSVQSGSDWQIETKIVEENGYQGLLCRRELYAQAAQV